MVAEGRLGKVKDVLWVLTAVNDPVSAVAESAPSSSQPEGVVDGPTGLLVPVCGAAMVGTTEGSASVLAVVHASSTQPPVSATPNTMRRRGRRIGGFSLAQAP